MIKKVAAIGCTVFLLFAAAGCSDPAAPPEQPPVVTDKTEYQDVVESPACPEIDDKDYTAYYFDAVGGNDNGNGLSPETAKKSLNELSKIASAAKEPTKILLKAGTEFAGRVTVRGYSATAEKPLIFDRYGSLTEYPLISGSGGAAFSVYGDNVRICNLEITNPSGTQGIYVDADKAGESSNVVIEGCYVHDIMWNWTSDKTVEEEADNIGNYDPNKICPTSMYHYATSGIYVNASNPENSYDARWFNGVWIRNNKVKTVGRCGIFVNSSWISGNGCNWGGKNKFRSLDDGWYPAKNLVISGNEVSYVGGDGILAIGVEDCYIERNVCLHAALLGRAGQACAGIWFINARRVYVQFNEAAYTHLENGCTDGEGFDIDIGCSDVLFQYNYSHDNAGGGLLICNVHAYDMPVWDENGNPVIDPDTGKQQTFESPGYWNNVRIRNNLFACNGRSGSNGAFLVMSSDCKNIICENNTVVQTPGLFSQHIITSADYGQCGRQENLICRNNVFYAESNQYSGIQLDYCESSLFENNLYHNFPESFFDIWTGIEDVKAIRDVDPGISVPQDRTGYGKIAEYRPENERVFTLGEPLQQLSVKDILGNATKGKKYLGAFCG